MRNLAIASFVSLASLMNHASIHSFETVMSYHAIVNVDEMGCWHLIVNNHEFFILALEHSDDCTKCGEHIAEWTREYLQLMDD